MRRRVGPRTAAIIAMLAAAAGAGCQSAGGPPAVGGPVIEPAAYLGRSEGEVQGALGRPDSARSELDAQVWQYAGPDCVVDFYFYPEGATSVVAHAEARNRADGGPLSRCAMRAG